MSTVIKHTLDDFSNMIFNGFTYTLDPDVIAIIQGLAEQVGAPEYVRTPQFQKNSDSQKPRRGKVRASHDISDEDWAAIRQFQATEIAKKEGIDACIDKIRVYLNKTTSSNFEIQKQAILNEIDKIVLNKTSEESVSNLEKVSHAVFGIASGNGFYSSLYARLYEELLTKYEFLDITLRQQFRKFDSLFNEIEWCDPRTNYDRFCEINKANDSRRAVSLFYVNLMKRGVIDEDKIIEIIKKVQSYLIREMKLEDRAPVVEELVEILYILVINSWTPEPEWSDTKSRQWLAKWKENAAGIYECICTLASTKATRHPSLSNKTVFKHMDMRDAVNRLGKVN